MLLFLQISVMCSLCNVLLGVWFLYVNYIVYKYMNASQSTKLYRLSAPSVRCESVLTLSTPPIYKQNVCITKYGSTLYIGMDEVSQHHAHTFEKSNLNFHFQCEFSSVVAEW